MECFFELEFFSQHWYPLQRSCTHAARPNTTRSTQLCLELALRLNLAARCPQEAVSVEPSAGSTARSTPHCCRVTSVVFSDACSDLTYAGHHLLCPLLTTLTVKSRSQTEWGCLPTGTLPERPSINSSDEISDVEGLDQNSPRHRRGRTIQTEVTVSAWHEGPPTLRFFAYDDDGWDEGDIRCCYGDPFRFETS